MTEPMARNEDRQVLTGNRVAHYREVGYVLVERPRRRRTPQRVS